jgi:hypothetical protein
VRMERGGGRLNGGLFAMKVLSKEELDANRLTANLLAERNILASLDHPFICKLRSVHKRVVWPFVLVWSVYGFYSVQAD